VPSDWKSLLFGSDVSDLYLQPHVGADIALLKAILKGVQERNAVDRSYCNSHAAGWAEVEVDLAYTPWEPLVEASGVSREEIDKAVDLIVSAKKGVLLWAMGLTHHVCGVDNILALANIAVARGWLGRPGMGLLPIRGHSNVQGVGSVGVGPDLKKAFSDQLERLYGIKAPRDVGQDTYSSMVAAEEGRIRAAVLLGGNLYSSNPDSGWAARALQRIPLTFTVSTKLNEGHIHGRGQTAIIVPALARDEESQSTTQESMFNFVRLSSGGFPSVEGELRSEVDIVASIAEKILPEGRFDWPALRSHESLRQMIAQVVPGYGKIGEIGKAGGEFHIEGRTFHTPKFNTPDGRARFHVTKVPKASLGPDEYRLMTLRSEGQFNTVVYEEEDLYRGNTRRDVVMMSEEDARKRGFAEGDLVEVTSSAGFLRGHVAIVDIRTGNLAMYYPEANVLVPRALDPQSKTPAFKSVAVTLERADKRKLREAAVAAGT
jgi:molybdopterin-dependent oxidoreductase alpha subunit